MANESDTGNGKKKQVGAELIIPAGALAFTFYYFSTIIDSPWTAQVSAFFIGFILIGLIAIFTVKSLVAVVRGEADLGVDALVAPRPLIPRRLGLFGLTLGFIIFVQWGGFTLTTFLFLGLSMLLLTSGRRRKLILILAASLSIGGYLLFILAFDTRFPEGPFEYLMQPLESMMDRGL